MAGRLLRARRPSGDPGALRAVDDPDVLASHLADAAHFPGGHATELFRPSNEAQVAFVLASARSVLAIGAQSSLTGGATPLGDTLLSTSRLDRIESIGTDTVRVQAGVTIAQLNEALRRAGRHYPPAPTFTGAFLGGTIATNAAGAATFKYGATREWVQAITVVLPGGDVLDIERGASRDDGTGVFELELQRGIVHVPIPSYRMPAVPKLSAGYFAAPGMDLIDLFIGSEGTLGVVTAATLRILRPPLGRCLIFAPLADRARALALVGQLRAASLETRRSGDQRGVDVSAIEHMDARCLELIRQDGTDKALGVVLPADAVMALLIALELPAETSAEGVLDQIGSALEPSAPDTPIVRVCRMLADAGALEHTEIVAPGDTRRAAALTALREAVPAAVNTRVGRAQRSIDPRIQKTAADMIVPFERLSELLEAYDAEFARRGLDAAVWGHISDGNLHPNVIPRSLADVESGQAAILELGRVVRAMGGAPLAEHGVGRSTVKQALLRGMYGDAGIEQMRAVKRAIDPAWTLAPGVLFPRDARWSRPLRPGADVR